MHWNIYKYIEYSVVVMSPDQCVLKHNTYMYRVQYVLLLCPQTSVVSRAEIDKAHNGLLTSVEEFLQELKSRHEQQRVEEEEAARVRKLRQDQVREGGREGGGREGG